MSPLLQLKLDGHRHPLILHSAEPGLGASAVFVAAPREAPESQNVFRVDVDQDEEDANWQGLYVESEFPLLDKRYGQIHITRARLTIDGRDSGVPLTVRQNPGLGSPWAQGVAVRFDEVGPDRLMAALAGGKTAVLQLYSDSGSPAFTWTYDVSLLREVPRALRLAKWRCNGAASAPPIAPSIVRTPTAATAATAHTASQVRPDPSTPPGMPPLPVGSAPSPQLAIYGTERYAANGRNFVRYRLEVRNRTAYPPELFVASPGLPSCGANTSASRSWVDIFDDKGARIYGFCALGGPEDLSKIWFAVAEGQPAPSSVYIVIKDRLTQKSFVSNRATLPGAAIAASTPSGGGGPSSRPATAPRFTDAQLMARQSLPLASWETDAKCRFQALPALQLKEANAKINLVASATYSIGVREPSPFETTFETLLQDSAADANWRGIYAMSGFQSHGDRYAQAQITRARLLIDGADSGLPLSVDHLPNEDESGWSKSVHVAVQEDKQDRLLTALSTGQTATLQLFARGAAPVFTGTFDVSTLREIPRALTLTRWRCS